MYCFHESRYSLFLDTGEFSGRHVALLSLGQILVFSFQYVRSIVVSFSTMSFGLVLRDYREVAVSRLVKTFFNPFPYTCSRNFNRLRFTRAKILKHTNNKSLYYVYHNCTLVGSYCIPGQICFFRLFFSIWQVFYCHESNFTCTSYCRS